MKFDERFKFKFEFCASVQQVAPSGLFVMDTAWPHVSSPFLLEKIDFTVFLITVVVARSHLWLMQWVRMTSTHEDLQGQVQKTRALPPLPPPVKYISNVVCDGKMMTFEKMELQKKLWSHACRSEVLKTFPVGHCFYHTCIFACNHLWLSPGPKIEDLSDDNYTVTVHSHQRRQRTIQRPIKIKNDYSTQWHQCLSAVWTSPYNSTQAIFYRSLSPLVWMFPNIPG